MRLEEWEGGDVTEVISDRVHSRVGYRNKQLLQVEIKNWKDVSPSLVECGLTLRVLVLLAFKTPSTIIVSFFLSFSVILPYMKLCAFHFQK